MKQTPLFFALMTPALILPGQAQEKGVQPKPPGHSIKLVVQIKSHEEGEELLVLASGDPYSIIRSHTDPNFEHSLELSDDATSLLGGKTVRLTYTVQRHNGNLEKGGKDLHSLRVQRNITVRKGHHPWQARRTFTHSHSNHC